MNFPRTRILPTVTVVGALLAGGALTPATAATPAATTTAVTATASKPKKPARLRITHKTRGTKVRVTVRAKTRKIETRIDQGNPTRRKLRHHKIKLTFPAGSEVWVRGVASRRVAGTRWVQAFTPAAKPGSPGKPGGPETPGKPGKPEDPRPHIYKCDYHALPNNPESRSDYRRYCGSLTPGTLDTTLTGGTPTACWVGRQEYPDWMYSDPTTTTGVELTYTLPLTWDAGDGETATPETRGWDNLKITDVKPGTLHFDKDLWPVWETRIRTITPGTKTVTVNLPYKLDADGTTWIGSHAQVRFDVHNSFGEQGSYVGPLDNPVLSHTTIATAHHKANYDQSLWLLFPRSGAQVDYSLFSHSEENKIPTSNGLGYGGIITDDAITTRDTIGTLCGQTHNISWE